MVHFEILCFTVYYWKYIHLNFASYTYVCCSGAPCVSRYFTTSQTNLLSKSTYKLRPMSLRPSSIKITGKENTNTTIQSL